MMAEDDWISSIYGNLASRPKLSRTGDRAKEVRNSMLAT